MAKEMYTFSEKLDVGEPGKCSDFIPITFDEARSEYKHYIHAAHGMVYAKNASILWDRYPVWCNILMQVRSDGYLGFPGGLLDMCDTEEVVDALNREFEEEMNLDLSVLQFTQKDFIMSHINHTNKLVTHFYAKESSLDVYESVEKNVIHAKEWGIETFGVLRVPLIIMDDGKRGLPMFLSNMFAGNAKHQLMHTISQHKLIPEDHVDKSMCTANMM